jgi:hypothetical protein
MDNIWAAVGAAPAEVTPPSRKRLANSPTRMRTFAIRDSFRQGISVLKSIVYLRQTAGELFRVKAKKALWRERAVKEVKMVKRNFDSFLGFFRSSSSLLHPRRVT